jgi:hypothetical protein
MLKVYLDKGQKTDGVDVVMSIAAVIFKPTRYVQFVRPWERMLRAWKATAFHATDFYSGAKEFERDTPARRALFERDSRRISNMVGPYIERILVVSFRPEEYLQKASPEWKAAFGTSIHSMAVQLCVISLGWWREKKCPSQSLAYFMESGDEDQVEVLKTVENMRHHPGTREVIAISSFSPVDKGRARGCEAADFCAWHWNKYYMDKMRKGLEMNPRRDFAALVSSSNEKFDYIFSSGAYLDYFFSLFPPEVLQGPGNIARLANEAKAKGQTT